MGGNRTGKALVAAAEDLIARLNPLMKKLRGERAPHVLNPLVYARENHLAYLTRWGRSDLDAVMFGMNPGPWGMGQTGVPFGDPGLVRDFLGIDGAVREPKDAHPRCPIRGVDSPRGEVSGQRLWGGVRDCFGAPGPFFERFFVANYCPLLFLGPKGANVTPDKLGPDKKPVMEKVLAVCDEHARRVVAATRPRHVLGVGAWATKRLGKALADAGDVPPIGTVLHPSPASPIANKGWLPAARAQLADLGCAWPEPDGGAA